MQVLPHVMKVSALREGTAMASPPPREMEEELASAGSEPGRCLWVQGGVGWLRGRWKGLNPILSWRGVVHDDGSVEVGVRGGVQRVCRMSWKV